METDLFDDPDVRAWLMWARVLYSGPEDTRCWLSYLQGTLRIFAGFFPWKPLDSKLEYSMEALRSHARVR